MRKQLLFFFLFFCFAHVVLCQKMQAEFRIGYGTFAMKDARLIMRRAMAQTPFPLKVVDDYPGFMVYSGSLSFPLNERNRLGFSIDKASTGSRGHHQDYSGEYRVDHLLNAISLGTWSQHLLASYAKEKLEVSFTAAGGIIFTTFKEKAYIRIYDTEESGENFLNAESLYLEPGFRCTYRLAKFLVTGISLSYLYDTQGKLHLAGNRDAFLAKSGNKPIKADWSGLRANFLVGLKF